MCLILFSYKNTPQYKLILISNRDEFHNRLTKPLNFWENNPDIISGIDMVGSGTWLGLNKNGRFAALTNYRDPLSIKANAPTRGDIVRNFLESNIDPKTYLIEIQKNNPKKYNGFNLLAGDLNSMYYTSNRINNVLNIEPGLYGLSNSLLNVSWPKLEKGKKELNRVISKNSKFSNEELFNILTDKTRPPENELPDTGIGLEWEKMLSSIFIQNPIYGTRSSSIILIDYENKARFIERTYDPIDYSKAATKTFCFIFKSRV